MLRVGFCAQNSKIVCEPKLDVNIINVFWKETIRPVESDKIPSSKFVIRYYKHLDELFQFHQKEQYNKVDF